MKKFLVLILFLSLINPCFADIEWVEYSFFKNVGGLNDGFAPVDIADNEAADLQNVIFTTGGNFKTRDGYAKINSSTLGASVVCTGLRFYKPTSGTRYLVGIFDNDKIYKMDYGASGGPDGTWDDVTGSLSFSIDQDNLASFSVGEDILIIEDGLNTTAPYKWTGSGNAVALAGSPPNATMVAYHKRHLFVAGNDSNPSTLYFSDLGNIETWSGGLSGNLSIETNDGTVITAIHPGFDSLYIWKGNSGNPTGSIWRLSGDDKDNFKLQRMVSGIGTLSHNSVSLIGNDFIFKDGKGDVYIYDGAIKVQLISPKIQGTIDALNFQRFKQTLSTVFEKDYYVSVSTVGSGTHNRVLLFDTFHLAWTKFNGMNVNAMTVADDGDGKDMLVFGDYSGFVYKYPSGTDDAGTAIVDYYTTKQFRFPKQNINKTFEKLYVFANQKGNYNLNVETRSGFGTTGTANALSLLGASSLYGTAVYGTDLYGGQNLIVGEIEPDIEGQFFQLRFYNDNADEPWEVKGFNFFISASDAI